MFYFTVLTDYGFNLSATKDISIHRNNISQLSRTFSEVIVTKALLLVLSFAILTSILFLVPDYKAYTSLILYSFTIVLGQFLLPTWFFQGVEKMKYITYINIFSRALYASSIFLFIRHADDYIYINLINGSSAIVGGLISLLIVLRKFKLQFLLPTPRDIRSQLVDGWNVFFSNVTVTIANNTNILILGVFATPIVLGYYSIAEKVYVLSRSLASILHQVVYPRVCVLASVSSLQLNAFLKNVFKVVLLAFLPLSLSLFFLSDYIVFLIAGEHLAQASLVLKVVAFGPLMAALCIPVSQTMLALQLTRNYAIIVSIGAAVNITLNFLLAHFYQAVGTAWCILITETLVTVMLYFTLQRFYPHYFFLSKTNVALQLETE